MPASWPVRDAERAGRNLTALRAALGPERLRDLLAPLGRSLHRAADADMALNNLERVLTAAGADALPALLEGRGRHLELLVQLLSTSQFFADLLAARPELLDALKPGRRAPDRADLQQILQQEVDAAPSDAGVLRAFRRFRQRQLLRIGAADVLRDRPLEDVTADLSRVADACLEVALSHALKTLGARFGVPQASCVLLAFGKHGGEELNYSSDLDLMLVYADEGATAGKGMPHDEFFGRVVSEVVRLLAAHTPDGAAYRVDLRLRPDGAKGPLARSLPGALAYYDTRGRTWERQALIKLRTAAGDAELGRAFWQGAEGFVYRKYLSFAEINGIKALKRKIERRAGADSGDVKTGKGGIRDIEFTVQFLQLLNGGDLPALRQRNTLKALHALAGAGCLTDQEYQLLAESYRFLRKTEHRLQLMFDLQTHQLPAGNDELRRLAQRSGYAEAGPRAPRTPGPARRLLDEQPPPQLTTRDLLIDPLDSFLHDYHAKTTLNRQILEHLLHATFADEPDGAEPESDLLLDPNPDDATVQAVLGRYPFRDVPAAYRSLTQLAQESVPYLSTRRCRHFLASIAPRLLRAVAETPDPDLALCNLEQVTASLGAKAVLWELFSFNPPSLKLYVDLCANSQFLADLLVGNPGMVDELLDSLVLNQPRELAELQAELTALCHGADDHAPILRSFQDKELLRLGVRDLLGKDGVRATTAALSDVAEALVGQLWELARHAVTAKLGPPVRADGTPCRAALLALGKLGGREMSYHSDLDVVLVYESDGPSDNLHWYSELARTLIKLASTPGPLGRLYQLDMRLRPTGKSGSLVVSLPELARYYGSASAQVWERQALTRARSVAGDLPVEEALRAAAYAPPWRPETAGAVRAMRAKLEAGARPLSLKRGPGGLADVEFAVQLLLLRHGAARPEVCRTNVWEALDALEAAELLSVDDAAALRAGYDFLRLVESRVRIETNRALTEIPESASERGKLAQRLGYASGELFLAEWEQLRRAVRAAFERVCSGVG